MLIQVYQVQVQVPMGVTKSRMNHLQAPDAARPILLVLGKEDKDLLHKIVPPVDAKMELQSSGVKLFDAEREFYLMLEFH